MISPGNRKELRQDLNPFPSTWNWAPYIFIFRTSPLAELQAQRVHVYIHHTRELGKTADAALHSVTQWLILNHFDYLFSGFFNSECGQTLRIESLCVKEAITQEFIQRCTVHHSPKLDERHDVQRSGNVGQKTRQQWVYRIWKSITSQIQWFGTIYVRFEVSTAVTMMSIIFWEMTPCGSYKNRRFGGSYRLQSSTSRCLYKSLQLRSVTCSHSCTLKMEAIRSWETSVLIRATRCHLPEDDNHQRNK
jgi:hypothetical protein